MEAFLYSMLYVFSFMAISLGVVYTIYSLDDYIFKKDVVSTDEVVLLNKSTGDLEVVTKYQFAFRTDMKYYHYIGEL